MKIKHSLLLVFTILLVLTIFLIPRPGRVEDLLITNVFIETDLRQILHDISTQARIPIAPDQSVQGVISMEFTEVPLEKCLEMLLFPLGFTFKNVDDYYIVTSVDPKSPSFSLVSETEVIKLNHVKAIDAMSNLPDFLKVYAKVNKDKNVFTITAPAYLIKMAKEYILTIDKSPKQILIEVLVTEISSEAGKSLGIKWETDLGIIGSGEYIFSQNDSFYQLRGKLTDTALLSLHALAETGKVKIRANPKIVTANAEEAVINIGVDKYVVLETSKITTYTSYTSLQSVSAGIKLKIVPYIGEDDSITLEIDQEVSDVVPTAVGDIKLSVNRRNTKTTVHLSDNQTMTIGGLTQQNKEERVYKIPLLGSIPILGKLLFSSTKTVSFENELVIFITPKIIPTQDHAASRRLR